MESDLLVEKIRSRLDHNQAKQVIKEKYQAKMFFAYNGGMWEAGPNLLAVLATVADEESVVLLDINSNPVEIKVDELKELAKQRWQECLNAWLVEQKAIGQQR